MTDKMRGWEFRKTHEPLVLVEKDIPKAKPGFAVIEVKNCGLCHTGQGDRSLVPLLFYNSKTNWLLNRL